MHENVLLYLHPLLKNSLDADIGKNFFLPLYRMIRNMCLCYIEVLLYLLEDIF